MTSMHGDTRGCSNTHAMYRLLRCLIRVILQNLAYTHVDGKPQLDAGSTLSLGRKYTHIHSMLRRIESQSYISTFSMYNVASGCGRPWLSTTFFVTLNKICLFAISPDPCSADHLHKLAWKVIC